ncbi:Tetratricopeptide TPR_1 repeat-containing protein [Bacteroides coprosuis DSM 18011]|uniref:Tetratricopeptide TPR_1 repeat-containing protein n=1 Tax=Bacteroides coprosuis DSM 18011 TaxID=679937 RepID=F3ZTE9_9BACE|nr:tetratricopeptide repeat protein [Bacteroides coprosuis]EGJ71039.1 Tetratricopeptide TPR_1 repeat-containing protein [Bacteroides coprosuis DSM 18011]HJD92725.1 tetratricopeptide repeat protein [Bacteroides coprosuis]
MKRKFLTILLLLPTLLFGQINTDRVMIIGRNALYFEDYILSIQYFNQVINAKPYLHLPYFFRSLAKLNLDDFKGAEDDCSKVLMRNPFFVAGYQVRGLARVQQGKYKEAIEDYYEALKYDPEDVPVWNNLALCYINEENYEKAKESLQELSRISPKYTPAYLMKGDVALREKDTVSAMGYLDEAIALDKYDANTWGARAMLYLMQEKYPEAEKDLDEATYLSGQDPMHYINRALARFHQNNLRGAMSDYDLALDIDPQNFIGHYNRGLLRARVGDYNRALEDFDFVLNIDPDNLMATFNRGLLRSRTGDFSGAEADYTKVIDVYPAFYAGYHYRAEARKMLGDAKGYEQDELTMLKMQMEKPTAGQNQKSKSDETRKRSDKNMENYKKLVVADKDDISRNYKSEYRGRIQNKKVQVKSEPYFTLSYYEKSNEVRQIIHYHKFMDELNNKHILPYPLVITNREKPLSQEEADKHFALVDVHTAGMAKQPNSVEYRFARGLDFFLVQDIDNAIDDFSAAIQIDKTFYPAYFMRSLAKIKQLDYERAESGQDISKDKSTVIDYELVLNDLSTVIKLAPDFVYAYYNRAHLYFELKDFPAALSDYTEAIKINPEFAEAYFNRGIIHIFLGNNKDGVSDLSKAGELGIAASYNIIKRFRDAK